MWCAQCMQDVPVVHSDQGACCARCQRALEPAARLRDSVPQKDPSSSVSASPLLRKETSDPWSQEQQLELLQVELLRTKAHLAAVAGVLEAENPSRVDLARELWLLRWDPPAQAASGTRLNPTSPSTPDAPLGATLANWAGEVLIYVATMFFSLGGVLGIWAQWGNRPQFWPIALPALVGSAVGFALGVGLRAWARGRVGKAPADSTPAATLPPTHRLDSRHKHRGPHWSAAVETVCRWPKPQAD